MSIGTANVNPTKRPACRLAAMVCALVVAAAGRAQDDSVPAPISARELLARYEIGPAQFAQLVDGSPIAGGEEEVLAKILFRFSRLGADNIHRWRKTDASWDAVAAAVHQEQGELFAIRGRAKRVTEHKLPTELAQRFEFARYYSVRMALDGSTHEAIVHARTVPKGWAVDEAIDEPTVVDGLLLKLGPADSGQQPLVFAAQRVGWLPESSPLARTGFDVGLLDAVRETNGKGLLAADREPFYQLLAALDHIQHKGGERGSAVLDVVPLLEQPAEHQGKLVNVRGTARRIVKVAVSDVGVRERLGLDHYYEIDLFVPLGEAKLRFGQPLAGEENPVFENTFPVTLVARRLPPGLAAGEDLHEQIAEDAVFFKLWTYQSAYMARFNRVQPAPLLIAAEPRWIPDAAPESGPWGTAVTALLVGLVVLIFAAWWWYERGDRSFRRSAAARTSAPRKGGVLDES